MRDTDCVAFLQWALPRLSMRWPGFRKVRRQVCRRIQARIEQLGLDSVASYRDYLEQVPQEWPQLDEFCRISISRFYRDRGAFNLLRGEVLPLLARNAAEHGRAIIRAWSAGCASGEEPYTLRIMWDLELEPLFPDRRLEIVATDASQHMLARAKDGRYPPSSLKDLPPEWRDRAFAAEGDSFCLQAAHRRGIDFRHQDIRVGQPSGTFDLILCRHVAFTYFDEPLQKTILGLLFKSLRPHGMLVTGTHEDLRKISSDIEECFGHSGMYRCHTE